MIDKKDFYNLIASLDGQPLEQYNRLAGDIDFTRYVVKIAPVNSTYDGSWTQMTVRVPQIIAEFPENLVSSPAGHTALEDFLIRRLAHVIMERARFDEQGVALQHLAIAEPGQEILPRTAISVMDEYIEARMRVRLPRFSGSIPGDELEAIFFEELPYAVTESLLYCNLDQKELDDFLKAMEYAVAIRQKLPSLGLVAFISQYAEVLSGETAGITDRGPVVIDDELLMQIDVPNRGAVSGIGIAEGITLILGNVYSGRIELMHALASGIYNHVPGDGRTKIYATSDAVYVPSEPGRAVHKVNLSAFIKGLNHDIVSSFSTDDASSFESQAAGVVEALEAGSRVLFFDEADSAGEFLSGDQRLNDLLSSSQMGAVSLAERARQMVDDLGVSIVVGGGASGVTDFIPIADRVLRIEDGRLSDITSEIKELGFEYPSGSSAPVDLSFLAKHRRWVVPASIDPSFGVDDAYISANDAATLEFGRYIIDLSCVRQLVDVYQTETIGRILHYIKLRYLDESHSIDRLLDFVDEDLKREGLESLSREMNGELARPRRYEVAAALNRLRSLRINIRSD